MQVVVFREMLKKMTLITMSQEKFQAQAEGEICPPSQKSNNHQYVNFFYFFLLIFAYLFQM